MSIIEKLATQGQQDIHNGLASVDSQKLRRLRNQQMRQLFSRFDEMQYRMEFVARIQGIEFINDAASRNVNATWFTLDSMESRVVWIARGGVTDSDYSKLIPVVRQKVEQLICVGKNNTMLHTAFDEAVPVVKDCADLGEAVRYAFYHNGEHCKVVYSPAVAFDVDMATDGAIFAHEVNEL